jgi:glutamine phosphoribosylpyrophosphate amidotransferase
LILKVDAGALTRDWTCVLKWSDCDRTANTKTTMSRRLTLLHKGLLVETPRMNNQQQQNQTTTTTTGSSRRLNLPFARNVASRDLQDVIIARRAGGAFCSLIIIALGSVTVSATTTTDPLCYWFYGWV